MPESRAAGLSAYEHARWPSEALGLRLFPWSFGPAWTDGLDPQSVIWSFNVISGPRSHSQDFLLDFLHCLYEIA